MDTYTNWADVPDILKTRTAIRKAGLQLAKGQKPIAIKTHWYWKIPDYYLYDIRNCVPRKPLSEAQEKAVKKAQAASLESRTCKNCGYVQGLGPHYRNKIYVIDGLCPDCMEEFEHDADRAQAARWASLILKQDNILILDSETTGLEGEIIELAIINIRGETAYNQRFKPSLPVEEGAMWVHGLTPEVLEGEPRFTDEYPKIKDLLTSANLVLIYNADFDVARLRQTCQLYSLPVIKFTDDCVMTWYAQFYGEWSNYWQSYKWQPLSGGDHSALGDCRATLDVLKHMAEAVGAAE